MEAIIDSVVIIGAYYRNDQWHTRASPIIQAIDSGSSQIYITDFILAEVINFLHHKAGHAAAVEALGALEDSDKIAIIRISDVQYASGRFWFEKYPRLSFVDALTVACLKDLGLHYIYSFDSDFDGIEGITRLVQPQTPEE